MDDLKDMLRDLNETLDMQSPEDKLNVAATTSLLREKLKGQKHSVKMLALGMLTAETIKEARG